MVPGLCHKWLICFTLKFIFRGLILQFYFTLKPMVYAYILFSIIQLVFISINCPRVVPQVVNLLYIEIYLQRTNFTILFYLETNGLCVHSVLNNLVGLYFHKLSQGCATSG